MAKWTDEELQELKEMIGKCDRYEMAERLGRSYSSVHNMVIKQGWVQMKPKGYTPEEDALLAEMLPTHSIKDIAATLGRKYGSIDHRIRRLKLKRRREREWTDEEDAFLGDMYPQMDVVQLGGELKRSIKSVIARLQVLELSNTSYHNYYRKQSLKGPTGLQPIPEEQRVTQRPAAVYSNPDYTRLPEYYSQKNVRGYAYQ